MPITQLANRCWVIDPAPHPHDEGVAHYDTEQAAKDAGKYDEPEDGPFTVRQLPDPCWTVRCDGVCDQALDEEGEGTLYHGETRAEVEGWLPGYDWVILDGGLVLCFDDQPDDAEPQPPRDLPGQLALEVGERAPDG